MDEINRSFVSSYGPWKSFTQNVSGAVRAKLAYLEWDFRDRSEAELFEEEPDDAPCEREGERAVLIGGRLPSFRGVRVQ